MFCSEKNLNILYLIARHSFLMMINYFMIGDERKKGWLYLHKQERKKKK